MMKSILVLVSLLVSSSAMAGRASPATCFNACKAMHGDYKCMVTFGDGPIMVVDQLSKSPSEGSKAKLGALRDCYYNADGEIFEIHYPGKKNFTMCSPTNNRRIPFACETMDESSSTRNVKMQPQQVQE